MLPVVVTVTLHASYGGKRYFVIGRKIPQNPALIFSKSQTWYLKDHSLLHNHDYICDSGD